MTELTEMTIAATANHSIGQRRDRSEKSRRLRINREHDAPDKPSKPDRIFASGSDGAGQDYFARIALLNMRGLDTISTQTLLPRRCKREDAAQPHRAPIAAQIRWIVARLWRRASMS
jgi:hypothetical protein